jgi:hypothetical protein
MEDNWYEEWQARYSEKFARWRKLRDDERAMVQIFLNDQKDTQTSLSPEQIANMTEFEIQEWLDSLEQEHKRTQQ